ncbi:hypothetical protein Lal_00040994 [Lupinus albus]|uniref:Uncharacterized protein n=1 Tax=Lupinus albus TaxID=3870 RepID=A0A6A5NU29_LUPAL|nr:hypothetical protein Lalb_Chr13g0303841 [Lupinus albus]KAF1887392.1 hypothetical protein Lal_00040994 [Lupinus albus]
MGCGKSKHDVASDNTLQRKKSPEAGNEHGTETKDNKVDNVVSSEVEQKNNENVKEVGIRGKVDESNDVKDKSLEVKEYKAIEEKTQEDVVHAPGAAGEENKPENKKEEVETKDTVQGKTLTKEEETKNTNKEETLTKEKETKNTNKEETLTKEKEETKDTNKEEALAKKKEETKDTNKEEALAKKKEETKDTNKEEALAKKEEETKDTNQKESLVKEEKTKETIVPTNEDEEKKLKAKQGQ